MPRTEGIPENEAREIEFLIKKYLAGSGSNLSDIARQLNEKYDSVESVQAISRQLKKGTLPFWKVLRMASVLGYELEWRKKEST